MALKDTMVRALEFTLKKKMGNHWRVLSGGMALFMTITLTADGEQISRSKGGCCGTIRRLL